MFRDEAGFTLIEVLAALAIMGIVVTLAVDALGWQTKLTKQYQARIETQQALRASMLVVEKEIRQAKSLNLLNQGEISIVRSNNQVVKFYVADKDFNGIKDLYMETDSIPNPVASNIEELAFNDKGLGKWEIHMVARQGGVEQKWVLTIRQRVY